VTSRWLVERAEPGYAAAGLVVAASTVGMGVGAPLMGRVVDRRDLRTMLAFTLVAQAAVAPPPQRTLKPATANSAAMNASPACALRENAQRKTVHPIGVLPGAPCAAGLQHAVGCGAERPNAAGR